jgi:predicted Fe-Mo cluster-binding NifX family protein
MMKVAVPMVAGQFSQHFGGADAFGLFEVDKAKGTILSKTVAQAPPHEHGAFPRWLQQQGASVILAGGMGPRAVQMFEQFGIQVVAGIAGGEPDDVVHAYLADTLVITGEVCGGGHLHACGDHGHHGE